MTAWLRSSTSVGSLVFLAASGLVGGCTPAPGFLEPSPYRIVDDSPTWSPVSDSIAFVRYYSTAEGPPGVYVVASSGTTTRLLTTEVPAFLRYSPTSTELLGVTRLGLISIDVKSGSQSVLLFTDNGILFPDWSASGDRVVYARLGKDYDEPVDSAGLHLFDRTTGVDVALVDASGSHLVSGGEPRWSPEDSLIAFIDNDGVGTCNDRTNLVERLMKPPAGYSVINPIWIEGGRRLLVTELSAVQRTIVIDVRTGNAAGWPVPVGIFDAVSPADTAFVYRDIDPAHRDLPTYVLFTRRLSDASGDTKRQLTFYHPEWGEKSSHPAGSGLRRSPAPRPITQTR
jgi:hypothetical protein